jgi:hypothetical protein
MIHYKDLWECEHGSLLWSMFIPGKSDHDRVVVRLVDTNCLLKGYKIRETWPQTHSIGEDGVEIDTSYIEIGHLVELLIRGNINYLWSVASHIVIRDSPLLGELKEIVMQNPSKLPYKSIRGMATSQKLDETKRPRLSGGKGYRTAARTALFGVGLLTSWEFNFKPCATIVNLDISREEVDRCIDMLDVAYEESNLPEKPNEKPFRDFLYRVRVEGWDIQEDWI